MKNLYDLCCLLLALLGTQVATAQALSCNQDLNVTIGSSGMAILTPHMILEGPLDDPSVQIKREGGTLADSLVLTCEDVNQIVTVIVESTATGNQCFSNVTVEDKTPPSPFCISLSTGVLDENNSIEIYAIDFNIGTFENCGGPIAYTFGDWGYPFAPVEINGELIDLSVDHYFSESGIISAVANTTPEIEADYNAGAIQKWDAGIGSSSQVLVTNVAPFFTNINMSVSDQWGNSQYCTVAMTLVEGQFEEGECVASQTREVQPFKCGPGDLVAADFIVEAGATNARISLGNAPYATVVEDPELGPGDYNVSVTYEVDDELHFCTVALTIEDNVPPVAVVDQDVTVALTLDPITGTLQAMIFPSTIDDGSYDHCGDVSLSLSQQLFDESHLGENNVVLTVTDESGNFNQAFVTVTVIEGEGCGNPLSDILTWPSANINLSDPAATPQNVSPSDLVSLWGVPEGFASPSLPSECIVWLGYDDSVTETPTTWLVVRTFTVLNWITGEVATFEQYITGIIGDALSVQCVNYATIYVDDSPVQLLAEDYVVDFGGDLSDLVLTVTTTAGDELVDNTVTEDMVPGTFHYVVTDQSTDDSCSGVLVALDSDTEPCAGGPGMSFDFPSTVIAIADSGVPAADLTPSVLVSQYGYTLADVQPIWSPICDMVLSTDYSDVVIPVGPAGAIGYKIARTWTVVDWGTGEAYTEIQVLKNYEDITVFMCDYLPWNTPIIDCDSGHTDTDDVEWPADIQVTDHRITPQELIASSGIDSRSASPHFFGSSPEQYFTTYVDVVVEFTSEYVLLERQWTAGRLDIADLFWSYKQEVKVVFSDFTNLVTASTPRGFAIPGVIINSSVLTDDQGRATLTAGDVLTTLKTESFNKGVDLRDLIFVREHILGARELDPEVVAAADLDGSTAPNTLDLVQARRSLLQLSVEEEVEWLFSDVTSEGAGIKPKTALRGYKPFDVDDSYHGLVGDRIQSDVTLHYADQLINNGETYTVHMRLSDAVDMRGSTFYFDIDESVLEVTGMSHVYTSENVSLDFGVLDGRLTIITQSNFPTYMVEDDPIFTIELFATGNGLLSQALKIAEDSESFYIDLAYDYNFVIAQIGGPISSTFDDPANALSYVSVYPNPASDLVTFDFVKADVQAVRIDLLATTGQLVRTVTGANTIDVSELAPGMYIYRISDGSSVFIQKLLVTK